MTNKRDCSKCEAVIFNKRIGYKTCKCNRDPNDRLSEGYYGWCHPDKCKGPDYPYVVLWGNTLKFLDK